MARESKADGTNPEMVTFMVATPIKTEEGVISAGEAYEAVPEDVADLVACGALIAEGISAADMAQLLQERAATGAA